MFFREKPWFQAASFSSFLYLFLTLTSCSSVVGRNFTSFVLITICDFLESLLFFFNWYLYLPKSMSLHTGGVLFGETSTTSSPTCSAIDNACPNDMFPSWEPFASMSNTSRAVILLLKRSSFSMYLSSLCFFCTSVPRFHQPKVPIAVFPCTAEYSQSSPAALCHQLLTDRESSVKLPL